MNQRIVIRPQETVVLAAVGLLPGERFQVRYVIPGDCGVDAGVIDFQPDCCSAYLGICDGTQANTGNPIELSGPPGTYEFVPDGIVAPGAVIYEVQRYYHAQPIAGQIGT
jgi:hypothetical protein